MRRTTLLVLLALSGCAGSKLPPIDTTLPDGEALAVRPAREALAEGAADRDPGTRGPALAALVRWTPADDLTRWAMQGTYDPEPWVQEAVIDALVQRLDEPAVVERVREVALRGSADAWVRARAAHALLDAGLDEGLEPLRFAWSGKEAWRVVPLALVALRLGESAAKVPLEEAVASGEMRDTPESWGALAAWGHEGLVDALAQGRRWIEEESGERYDLVRAALGDPAGRAAVRAVLNGADTWRARDLLDVILALPDEARAMALKDAKGAADPAVRDLAKVALRPTPGAVRRLVGDGDAFVRAAGLRLAAGLPAADRASVARVGLVDGDASVREAAAVLAGPLRDPSLRPLLEAAAADDRAEVRMAAYGALLGLDARASAEDR